MALEKKEEDRLREKYRRKLGEHISIEPAKLTANYMEFKKAFMPKNLSRYEEFCKFSEKITKGMLKPGKKQQEELLEHIRVCHLEVTPTGVVTFSYLAPAVLILIGTIFSILLFGENSLFFIFYFLLMALVLVAILQKLPEFFANNWRLKASNQMVQCIFYVVTYMRHTSNLELAVNFAAEHLSPPLSLDLKKVLWDVETEHYATIKESLDYYLEGWRKYNLEFIESFHLIEGSLYEPSEDRRVSLIEKSLQVMLEETYEKMLHFSHELKGPITLLYMLGIILPLLGLVILPLVASFLTSGSITPYFMAIMLAVLYNVTLPLIIFYMGKMVLSKRPTGYGDTDISEQNPELKRYSNILINFGNSQIEINPLIMCLMLLFIFAVIGLIPVWFHYLVPPYNQPDYYKQEVDLSGEAKLNFKFLDFRASTNSDRVIGPYGMIATLLSLFLIFGIGFSFGLYYKLKSQYLIQLRDNAKKLEQEFASALFQLGNRLGDGIPAEIAFGKVAEMMKDTTSGDFFELVSMNITRLGIGIEKAIFDTRLGALIYFPSNLIESSMKVLVESVKKGPLIASQALINVSQYIKEIHRVNERVKDLLADIISDMKQQISVLAPAIAGIVVGITSMIVLILIKLTDQIRQLSETTSSAAGQSSGLLQIFGDPIPTYYFQIIVGLYVVEVTYVLTVLINGIENGSDKLGEQDALSKNLMRGTMLYCIICLIVIITFNFLAATILNNIQLAA
jgi:hypothetical protein